MKRIINSVYDFLYVMGKTRAAAYYAQIGRHDLAVKMMNLPK
jgi:hypothetical protein